MRIVGCGLIAIAALLGPAPVAAAGAAAELKSATPQAEMSAAPQTGVSLLALALTAGGAIAAVGSGVALARRREAGRRVAGDHEAGRFGVGSLADQSSQPKVRVTALRH